MPNSLSTCEPASLTISILTRNGGDRLEILLAEASHIAQQIVVGVDADSDQHTLEVATRFADVVFRFRHSGELSAARMMILDYAICDWILVIDDDERLEAGFETLLPALLKDPVPTHYWFPRKWIVNDAPYEYLVAPLWYPDWQLRLFRNDRSLVWKPARPHSGYHVSGPGYFIGETAILHMERLWCTPQERQKKLERYRAAKPRGDWEPQYGPSSNAQLLPCTGPAEVAMAPHRAAGMAGTMITHVLDATQPATASWGMEVVHVDMAPIAYCGSGVVAKVTVRNTGSLTWWPHWGARSALLGFSHHLLDPDYQTIDWDCKRTFMPSPVNPGSEAVYIHEFPAPDIPGDFILQWDIVNEGEFWFSSDVSYPPSYSSLQVIEITKPDCT